MDKIVIDGGRALSGRVRVSGSKNAALPLIAAALLTEEKFELENVPNLMDVRTMVRLLKGMGVETSSWGKRHSFKARRIVNHEAPYDLVRTMRASILVLGPLLARTGRARVSLPGGCAIGARPVNLHLSALEQMGATIKLDGGYVDATCTRLQGAKIRFDQVTVTGTENIMMAACLAEGETILENAAREPEVVDLADALRAMGADIDGIGTETIRIRGKMRLGAAKHSVIPDRIEAGTFLIAAALAGGTITVEDAIPAHLDALIEKLRAAGAEVLPSGTSVKIKGPKRIKPVDVVTAPYPGFATDFQAQFMTLMTMAEGESEVIETIFENRYMHVLELNRMGANLSIDGHHVRVKGVEALQGAPVMATDLRASASLVLAGLAAKGITEIHRVYHIDRGYEEIEKKFRKLGARVKRVKVKY